MSNATTMYFFTKVQYDFIRDREILKNELWDEVEEVIKHSSDWDMMTILISSQSSAPKAKVKTDGL